MIITVYKDRSFTFIMKTPPASDLLGRLPVSSKGSGVPHKDKVGKSRKLRFGRLRRRNVRSECG